MIPYSLKRYANPSPAYVVICETPSINSIWKYIQTLLRFIGGDYDEKFEIKKPCILFI